MKNTIWVFGDSFSWDYKQRFSRNQINFETDQAWDYIQNHLNGEIFSSWGELLSKYLGYDYKNYSAGTDITIPNISEVFNSNDDMLNAVSQCVSQFKKDDIVFLGFTDICRFRWGWLDSDGNEVVQSILPSSPFSSNLKNNETTLNDILINRSELKFYIYDLLQQLKPLELLSDIVGFKLYYWDWSDYFDNMVYENRLPNDRWIFFQSDTRYKNYGNLIWDIYGKGPICWETDFKNPDSHMGKIGHEIHAQHLYNYLKNIL